jgi:hypothetical protein
MDHPQAVQQLPVVFAFSDRGIDYALVISSNGRALLLQLQYNWGNSLVSLTTTSPNLPMDHVNRRSEAEIGSVLASSFLYESRTSLDVSNRKFHLYEPFLDSSNWWFHNPRHKGQTTRSSTCVLFIRTLSAFGQCDMNTGFKSSYSAGLENHFRVFDRHCLLPVIAIFGPFGASSFMRTAFKWFCCVFVHERRTAVFHREEC